MEPVLRKDLRPAVIEDMPIWVGDPPHQGARYTFLLGIALIQVGARH